MEWLIAFSQLAAMYGVLLFITFIVRKNSEKLEELRRKCMKIQVAYEDLEQENADLVSTLESTRKWILKNARNVEGADQQLERIFDAQY